MKRALTVWLVATVFFLFSPVFYAADEDVYSSYNQSLMKANGTYMGMIGAILEFDLPYKHHISSLARSIASNNGLVEQSFEKKTVTGQTDAKAEIWLQWSTFAQAAANSAQAADKLVAVVSTQDFDAIAPTFRDLGKTCSACHSQFRKPKHLRFKR